MQRKRCVAQCMPKRNHFRLSYLSDPDSFIDLINAVLYSQDTYNRIQIVCDIEHNIAFIAVAALNTVTFLFAYFIRRVRMYIKVTVNINNYLRLNNQMLI